MSKRKDVLEGAEITINKNVLSYEDTIVQLSCISKVTIAPIPKEKYPTWAIIGFLLGLLAFKMMVIFATIVLGVCGCFLYMVYQKNEENGKYLILELNSGKLIFFSSTDETFLKKALEVLKECFNGSRSTCFINFGNYQIGSYNTINS